MPTLFDYAVIAVVTLSAIVGALRGGVRELLGLTSWIVAFIAARAFSGSVAAWLPPSLGGHAVRAVLSFVGVFLLTLLVVGVLSTIAVSLLRRAGLGTADGLLGLAIGLARGLLICLVTVLLAGLTPLPGLPEWRNAVSSGWFEKWVGELRPYLPEGFSRRLNYNHTRA
jgi:membrane protein required for colicin V production